MSWNRFKVEEIAEISLGKMLDEKKNKGEFHFYLANVNVRWGIFNLIDLRQMKFENHEKERYKLQKGDIIMCEGGEPGRCAIWKEQMPVMMYQKALHRIRTNKEFNSNFIYYSFLFLSNSNGFAQFCTGATIKHLPKEKLAKIELPIPPLPTQRRIASILSAYDDLIENNLKRIKLLEESAQRTYEEWFLKFRVNGKQIPINDKTGLPVGWERKKITNCNSFKQHKEKVKKFDGELIYLATADVEGAQITGPGESVTWENKPSRAQIKLIKESVWFARMSNTYKVIIVSSNFNKQYIISSGFAGFISKNSHCLPFLFCLINSKDFHDKKDLFATGATQVSLNDISLGTIEITEPPLDLVELFGEKFIKTLEIRQNLIDQNQKLKESRDILLPKLMNGTINVEKV